MAAHLRNPGNATTNVRVYDSARLGARGAYLQAQLDGADFIVGPLLRPEVDQVIASGRLRADVGAELRDGRHDVPAQLLPVRAGAGGRSAHDRGSRDRGGREDGGRVRAEQSARLRDPRQLPSAHSRTPAASCSIGTATSRRCRISRQPVAGVVERDAQPRAASAPRGESRRAGAVSRAAPPPRRRHDLRRRVRLAHRAACSLRSCASTAPATFRSTRRRDIFDPGAHGARQRFERLHLRGHAGAARARRRRGRRARRGAGLLAAAQRRSCAFYGMGFDAYGARRARCTRTTARPWSMRGMSGDLSLDAQGRVRRVAAARAVPQRAPRRARRARRAQPIDSRGSSANAECALAARPTLGVARRDLPRAAWARRSSRAAIVVGSASSTSCAATIAQLVIVEVRARSRGALCSARREHRPAQAPRIIQATRHLLMRHAEWQARADSLRRRRVRRASTRREPRFSWIKNAFDAS